jgi:hypothetical protein
MKKNAISVQQYKEILNRLDVLGKNLETNKNTLENQLFNNQQLSKYLDASLRTLQSWRDEGKIPFSQIGSKIYYRMSDVQKLLDANYRKAFNPKRTKF